MEPRNIVDDELQERVSAEAAILNSRLHYYGRLAGSSGSDRLLVPLSSPLLAFSVRFTSHSRTAGLRARRQSGLLQTPQSRSSVCVQSRSLWVSDTSTLSFSPIIAQKRARFRKQSVVTCSPGGTTLKLLLARVASTLFQPCQRVRT